MLRKYWAHFIAVGRRWRIGPFATRSTAVVAALAHDPKPDAKTLYTGYGVSKACAQHDLRWYEPWVKLCAPAPSSKSWE